MNKLLCTKRLRSSTALGERTDKQIFESDRGRVIFSAPFRRLQSKAQVFSLEWNASVRSRLTHTMEVAHIGRYIVQQLSNKANKDGEAEFIEQCKGIEIVVETACLLHDIGNPPFGHLGEKAIQDWFSKNAEEKFYHSMIKSLDEEEIKKLDKEKIINPVKKNSYYKDFINFDGNPQGLRIILTLQGFPEKKGLNLTYSQIASLIKYPKLSTDKNEKYKKIGVFTSEKNDIKKIWKKLGLKWGDRHPFVYLMEAADDIAYSLSDIEDGIEKGIITEEQVFSHLQESFTDLPKEISSHLPSCSDKGPNVVTKDFVGFRIKMINALTEIAAEFFYEKREDLKKIDNSKIKEVFDHNKQENIYAKALNKINSYCKDSIYQSKEAEDIEIAGYNIVYGILDKYSILLELDENGFDKLIKNKGGNNLERRMFSKIPKSLVTHYSAAKKNDPDNEWYIRSQLLVDFVSGMTDDYALKMFKLINGIEIQVL